jgi:hypothetical protein
MTKTEIQSLIDTNLASGTNITAIEHRAVETAILNFIEDSTPLLKGTLTIGNVPAITSSYNVTFATTLSTSDYIVCGTIISKGNGQADNEVQYAVGNKTTTGFTIYIRETANVTQNIDFDYVIFKR